MKSLDPVFPLCTYQTSMGLSSPFTLKNLVLQSTSGMQSIDRYESQNIFVCWLSMRSTDLLTGLGSGRSLLNTVTFTLPWPDGIYADTAWQSRTQSPEMLVLCVLNYVVPSTMQLLPALSSQEVRWRPVHVYSVLSKSSSYDTVHSQNSYSIWYCCVAIDICCAFYVVSVVTCWVSWKKCVFVCGIAHYSTFNKVYRKNFVNSCPGRIL